MSDVPPINIYSMTVPVLLNGIKNLTHILDKAEAYAAEKKIDPSVVIEARLALDMHPLRRQIQSVSDTAKGAVARLSGTENPSMPDTETTFAELKERLQKTVDFIKSVDPALFEGAETRDVVLKTPAREINFTGYSYVIGFVLPNLFFHITTAYAILRHNGVDLGKADYLRGG
ncbi:DUF1993 domain-containing protein [Asticcacaulis sp. BYS171W]|uniref:DUF1993 domain-containing protein n=1 Tax=Asticcacaulis aquaticus TaxID=2984212 RepID=A0ABT5HXK2_9CAUL|nr:DUF1993 domain-containing protein [Asticcacaulis aquaticus]MDC7684797.1 DUF1993 domain-containing protein [Asticcacaulis aquaticus]